MTPTAMPIRKAPTGTPNWIQWTALAIVGDARAIPIPSANAVEATPHCALDRRLRAVSVESETAAPRRLVMD